MDNGRTTASESPELAAFAGDLCNLADERLGARVVAVSDDFFADAQRMLSPRLPVFIDAKYDDHGKWMDGWESRRKRGAGNDWAVIQLGRAGIALKFKLGHAGTLARLEIDTAHFKGNYPHQCSVQAAYTPNAAPASLASRSIYWQTLLAPTDMSADVIESFSKLTELGVISHLRLNMHPDGGVSRFRAFGLPGDH